MLVQSKIDKSQWIWINIPKTASTFIRNCLYGNKNILDVQTHLTYLENVHVFYTETAKNIRLFGKNLRIQELKKIYNYEDEIESRKN